jgi:hypothetical protein
MNFLPVDRKQTSVLLFVALIPSVLLAGFARQETESGERGASGIVQTGCHPILSHGIISHQPAIKGKPHSSHNDCHGSIGDREIGHASTLRGRVSVERHARAGLEPLQLLLLSTEIFSARL